MDGLQTVPARRGKAAFVNAGQTIKVVNTHGEQVVDTRAFNRENMGEFMSMEHTRAHALRLIPQPGNVLRTNHRRPILTLFEDTSGGIHDTLMGGDGSRHRLFGLPSKHPADQWGRQRSCRGAFQHRMTSRAHDAENA